MEKEQIGEDRTEKEQSPAVTKLLGKYKQMEVSTTTKEQKVNDVCARVAENNKK